MPVAELAEKPAGPTLLQPLPSKAMTVALKLDVLKSVNATTGIPEMGVMAKTSDGVVSDVNPGMPTGANPVLSEYDWTVALCEEFLSEYTT